MSILATARMQIMHDNGNGWESLFFPLIIQLAIAQVQELDATVEVVKLHFPSILLGLTRTLAIAQRALWTWVLGIQSLN